MGMVVPTGEQLLQIVNENTLFKMTPRWVRNIVANEELIREGHGIVEFLPVEGETPLTQHMPGLVVSGGPSVDKNLHLLEHVNERAVIICVDSMLKNVMKLGIKPNFVILTDAEWGEWGNCFDDLPMSTKDIPLLVDIFINKKMLEKWEGDIFWYQIAPSESSPLSRVADPEFTGHSIGQLACGGCVSSMAFSFLYSYLRCDPIVLIGQDCGYYDPQFHHAKNIDVTQDRRNEEVVKDIYDRDMITSPTLKAYKYWFETVVSGKFNPPITQINGTFINATEGGCLYRGWLTQPLSYAINRYMRNKYDFNALFADQVKAKREEIAKKKAEEAEKEKQEEHSNGKSTVGRPTN